MMRSLPLFFTLAACGHTTHEAPESLGELTDRVDFARPEVPDRVPVTTLPAEVIPAPGGRHDLGPGVEGRLVEWQVAVGDPVAAGQPLATLRSSQLSALSSQQSEQSSAIAQAEEALRLARAGAERGVRSAADVQQAEAQLAAAQASRRAATSQLAAFDTTTRSADGWVWRAPVGGRIDTITCPLGGVRTDSVCVGLVSTASVLLEVRVPERHLAALSTPIEATFLSADGQSTGFRESGRAAAIEPHTRTQTFHLVPTGEAPPPLQGASGRARLSVASDGQTHRIAADALTWLDGVPTVFVRTGQGIEAEARPVEVVGHEDDAVMVRGLQDSDRVAVRGVFLLKSLAALGEAE